VREAVSFLAKKVACVGDEENEETPRPSHHPHFSPLPPSLFTPFTPSTDTFFCVDKSVTAVVIQGLAEHKEELGAPLCPCR
jgi:hypothetical protein